MEPENPPKKDSFYQVAYSLEEISDLMNIEMDNSLEDEIAAVRVATRRILKRMDEELETAEFLALVDRLHRGATTVATLLRTQRATSGQAADGLANAIAQIIQELATENDWSVLLNNG